jgi:hypothetical protein
LLEGRKLKVLYYYESGIPIFLTHEAAAPPPRYVRAGSPSLVLAIRQSFFFSGFYYGISTRFRNTKGTDHTITSIAATTTSLTKGPTAATHPPWPRVLNPKPSPYPPRYRATTTPDMRRSQRRFLGQEPLKKEGSVRTLTLRLRHPLVWTIQMPPSPLPMTALGHAVPRTANAPCISAGKFPVDHLCIDHSAIALERRYHRVAIERRTWVSARGLIVPKDGIEKGSQSPLV